MTTDQALVFGILLMTLVLFVWGKVRYDLVALTALLMVSVFGLVPMDQVFLGFGHPAVITVAAVLVLSRGLFNAGAVDLLSRHMAKVGTSPSSSLAQDTGLSETFSPIKNRTISLDEVLSTDMRLRTMGYILTQGIRNLFRNHLMTLASITTITASQGIRSSR